jgi:hypothetical protein
MLPIVSALGLLLSAVGIEDGVEERERLAKEAIKEFYVCLLQETTASGCPDILEGSESALREIPADVRSSLSGATPAAKYWAYLRTHHRRALEPVGGGKHIRFVTSSLAGPSNLDVLPVEVVAGAREPAQSTGVVKIIGFGLTWSPQRGRYLVSAGMVNGVFLTHPDPRPWPPRDLSWLLGFEEERAPQR